MTSAELPSTGVALRFFYALMAVFAPPHERGAILRRTDRH